MSAIHSVHSCSAVIQLCVLGDFFFQALGLLCLMDEPPYVLLHTIALKVCMFHILKSSTSSHFL